MTLTELHYIVALAKTKHFGKAAEVCHITQPTLSIAVSKLEASLGVIIFERHRNELRITDIGKKIIQQTQRALEEVAQVEVIASENKSQLDSPLKIGAIHTVAPYLFPELIPKIKKRATQMPLIIQEDYTDNLRVKLQNGDLDAIFISLPFTEAGVVTKKLYDEPFVVLMRKDHPLASQKNIACVDLKNNAVLMLGQRNCFRNQVIQACPQCCDANSDQTTFEGASLETLRHMVAAGTGITILPSMATQIKNYSHLLCVKPFKTKTPQRTIALAWRSSFSRTKAIDVLIRAISDCHFDAVCVIG